MKIKHFVTIAALSIMLYACSGVKLQDYPQEPCAKIPGVKTVAIINDKCSLCHKGDFATKELMCARKAIIIDAVTSKRMPKFKKITDDEIQTIVKWEF